jgi:hypothetical protein
MRYAYPFDTEPQPEGGFTDRRLSFVVRPDRAQAELLDRLGPHMPERLRMPFA